ncbi:MAG: heavy-metal-associated domain-containing protein [Alphaproteobacteria bacterium]
MSRIIRTAVVALALLLPAAAFAAQAKYELQVDGLACPFCAYGIEKQLTRTDGVTAIDVDINAGTVTVTMADGAKLARDQASRIVEDAGFTLRDFTELPAAD